MRNNTSLFDLAGRTALVTGSGQGLGLAMATGLANAGARVVLNGRSEERLAETAATLRAAGHDALTCAFDVTDADAAAAAVDALETTGTTIDILVNNAGIQRRAPLEDFSRKDWDDIMRTNIDSLFFVGQAVARHMIKRGHGKIINIASIQSELARPTIAPYTASKGAVKNLTKGMCADWAKYGLQVNAIGPGYFATPLNQALMDNPEFDAWVKKRVPTGRWGDMSDLHGAVVFLASSASNFVNGHTLYVDGGLLAAI